MAKEKDEFPSWADPVHYRFVRGLTCRQFIDELYARAYLFDHPDDECARSELYTRIIGHSNQHRIAGALPTDKQKVLEGLDGLRWMHSYSVHPLSVAFAQMYARTTPCDITTPAYIPNSNPATQVLPVLLHIGSASDEEILREMKRLLPMWREAISAPEPEVDVSERPEKAVRRLAGRNVLMALDLLFHLHLHPREYSVEALSLRAVGSGWGGKGGVKMLTDEARDKNFLKQLVIGLGENNSLDLLIFS